MYHWGAEGLEDEGPVHLRCLQEGQRCLVPQPQIPDAKEMGYRGQVRVTSLTLKRVTKQTQGLNVVYLKFLSLCFYIYTSSYR